VSVDIRFWFVAVWNEAESQDCDIKELEKCRSEYQGFTYKDLIHAAGTKEELDRRCG
jgi:hypothetical protein